MTMYLCRRAAFSAGLLHPLANGKGGGHNYLCELTVGGQIDARTGMVVNIRDVDAVLKSRVVRPLDGTLLDRDVPAFRAAPPTPENIARFVWDECGSALPPGSRLARVTLWSVPAVRAEISGLAPQGDAPVQTIARLYDFSASHRLHSSHLSDDENADIFGKCNRANGHGHNYELEVTLTGEPNAKTGEIAPLTVLDMVVDEEVLTPYDHQHLNLDAPEFAALNPTSENLTRVIWEKLFRRLEKTDLGSARLYKVAVRETARNSFEYYGEQP